MLQKGFTAIVNKMHIQAMRSTSSYDVMAGQSDAQFFDVFRRGTSGQLVLVKRERSFDSAFEYCVNLNSVLH
ncbi:hypothetical protein SAMN05216345_111115 [Cupriavidus sp. YR651]|uniref:hypothetical protein n=1 Tax=Cupriavidus sp. YR651 TaxID=1855315 RepID=UPI000884D1CB|nr:hypothetical protein [Cupriavidus sp. YR651]SDD57781.1 hypothetical protein SAMN05216345_111115 [Cupriavidus sp. YR651]